jgi:hypothetical protein
MPRLFNDVLDLCEYAGGYVNPLVKTFLPGLRTQLQSFLHACPYQVILDIGITALF